MKKVLIIVPIALLFFSCNQNRSPIKLGEKDIQNSIEKEIAKDQLIGLYSFHGNGNSIEFEITEAGDQVIGKLIYLLAEKDKNTGTFKGTLYGNKLIGDYLFQSEGIESTRQIAFELKGDQLIEGYGLMNEEGDAFKDTSKINYSSSMPLIKNELKE